LINGAVTGSASGDGIGLARGDIHRKPGILRHLSKILRASQRRTFARSKLGKL
jgi:hypothetical protein